ncbi:MAG: N-acetylneuraminate synthase family protein [Candidatus Margulisiibacteriota bacterium]
MKKPFLVAEIAQGYEGSSKLVNLYVKAAATAKADAIKFQIFYADELALPDYKYYRLFKSLELPFTVWQKAVAQSHRHQMEFYSDVFGVASLSKLNQIGVDGFKVHSTDINNFVLLKNIAKTKKKIFLSTGGCQLNEISRALEIFADCKVTLMYGFQAEPTALVDNKLKRIRTLIDSFNKDIGFQDHTAGGAALALSLPFVAMGMGVKVVEKHLTLSRAAEIEDSISALTPEEFMPWAKSLKEAYRALGEEKWELSQSEMGYRTNVRRAVCSTRKLKKGTRLRAEDIILKRTDNAKALFDLSQVIGRKLKKAISKNALILLEELL